MKDEVVGFETAKLAKEKGFDAIVSCGYTDEGLEYRPSYWDIDCDVNEIVLKNDSLDKDTAKYLAPTQSLLQRWLREVHSIDCWIAPFIGEDEECYSGIIFKNKQDAFIDEDVFGNSYEESLEKLLQEALKLIK